MRHWRIRHKQLQYGGRSSVGRAQDCGSWCRGFDSHRPPHIPENARPRAWRFRFEHDHADVVKLVDTPDLGSGAARCESSSLSVRTILSPLSGPMTKPLLLGSGAPSPSIPSPPRSPRKRESLPLGATKKADSQYEPAYSHPRESTAGTSAPPPARPCHRKSGFPPGDSAHAPWPMRFPPTGGPRRNP